MKRTLTLMVVMLLADMMIHAEVRPRNLVFQHDQKDGTELTVMNISTPELHYFTTVDGYLLENNSDGVLCYVTAISNGQYVVSTCVAHNPSDRTATEKSFASSLKSARLILEESGIPGKVDNESSQSNKVSLRTLGTKESAALQCTGRPKVPVVLVQFKDLSFTIAEQPSKVNEIFDGFLNGDGSGELYKKAGSYGSVQDYFAQQSDSQFIPEFEVIGPVTLPDSIGFYGKNSSSRKDVNITTFYSHSVSEAQKIFSDWSIFDNNGDNVVDMVFFIFAGLGENDKSADANHSIWPKETQTGGNINNMKVGCYACCNEIYDGGLDGIGTFCHELSHALGLPDLYDTNYVGFGLDYWDLMDSGNYCQDSKKPCGYSSYELDFMGWRRLETLDPQTPQFLTLQPISEGGIGYKMLNSSHPSEYYIIENRQNTEWDEFVGFSTSGYGLHHGMLVTYVDYSASSWTANTVNTNANRQRVTILPADGELISNNSVTKGGVDVLTYILNLGGDPFPGNMDVHELKGEDQPLRYPSDSYLNQPLMDIQENEEGVITLKYCITEKADAPDDVEIYSDMLDWEDVYPAGDVSYLVQIAADENFSDILLEQESPLSSLAYSYDELIMSLTGGDSDVPLYLRFKTLSSTMLDSDWSDTYTIYQPATNIQLMERATFRVAVTGNMLVARNENTAVSVFTLDGKEMAASAGGYLAVSLPSGIYMVKSGTVVRKVVLK